MGEVLLLKDEVYKIAGCAMTVLNTLGHGFCEKVYENALLVEFAVQGVPYAQQVGYDVFYKDVQVGRYVPDLIAFNQIVVEIKTIDGIAHHQAAQIINYMKVTGFQVGMILNFKHAKLEWQRFVL
ncbi:MAG: GxxExxY protein [Micavibrio aeruginosavorus]|uniref:GxxExxY protein n=1 Tax=Micavibrio aeruginosavorus TaxID=349221 RepID=A0A7T5R3T5_9BACT|nr:MAG: GxxExxY protein [Micavibrio aeruginosavorus]